MNLIKVNDNNFDLEVLQAELPVLVDFTAVWCGPCQRQLPIIEKFAAENKDRVKVVELDIDDAPAISAKLGIKSVPSIVLFNKGQKIDIKIGLTSLVALDAFLSEKIKK